MRLIVTGADGVLGEAVVSALIERGDAVVGFVQQSAAETLESNILVTDLGNPPEANVAVEQAVARLGGLDAVINIAGSFQWLPVVDSRLDDWHALFASNVATTLNVVQAALPHLANDATIVCTGAAAASHAQVGMAPYAAAKSALARLVESLSAELATRRIRVNAIAPAIIDTPRNRADMPDADPAAWTSPAAIADVVLFLASHQSRAVNGVILPATNNA